MTEGVPLHRMSREAFMATTGGSMDDITRDPAAALDVDVWPYAETAISMEFPQQNAAKWDVRYVYRSPDHAHQHVFIRTHRRQLFLVIVLEAQGPGIMGHYVLDMSE